MKSTKGITLIALVITIIVLLILAGITINLTIGEHGILTMAKEAGKNYQNAAEYEQGAIVDFFNEAQNIIAGGNGGGINQGGTEESENPTGVWRLVDKVNVGDYVAYDPTLGVTDTSKLTYTSPVGTGTSHGNGYQSQTFTANSSDKWKVLSKNMASGEVILIGRVKSDKSSYFSMKGAVGYLYASQELASICSIYGYGKGAETKYVYKYTIGGPGDGVIEMTSTGGAACPSLAFINTLVGYKGTLGEETTSVLAETFPTIYTESGVSSEKAKVTARDSRVAYHIKEYLDENNPLYKILSENSMWLLQKEMYYDTYWRYNIAGIWPGGQVGYEKLCNGGMNGLVEDTLNNIASVCPIILLKNTIKTSGQDEDGVWNIIDE